MEKWYKAILAKERAALRSVAMAAVEYAEALASLEKARLDADEAEDTEAGGMLARERGKAIECAAAKDVNKKQSVVRAATRVASAWTEARMLAKRACK